MSGIVTPIAVMPGLTIEMSLILTIGFTVTVILIGIIGWFLKRGMDQIYTKLDKVDLFPDRFADKVDTGEVLDQLCIVKNDHEKRIFLMEELWLRHREQDG